MFLFLSLSNRILDFHTKVGIWNYKNLECVKYKNISYLSGTRKDFIVFEK